MTIERVARKGGGAHDQGGSIGQRNTHLGAKFKGIAALALVDALHLGGLPAVQLGRPEAGRLFVGGLTDYLTDLGKGLITVVAPTQGCSLAFDLALQAAHDCALTLDRRAHALELEKT